MAQLFDQFGVLITADNEQFKAAFLEAQKLPENLKVKLKDLEVQGRKTGKELGTAGNRARKAGTQINRASQHTANLAAQFNDIGVMLAAGQSPLMLAMQQGTQINQIFQSLGGTMKSVGATMRAALGSILNPMSLAVIGVIALTAQVVKMGTAWWEAKTAAEGMIGTLTSKEFTQLTEGLDDAIKSQKIALLQKQENIGTTKLAEIQFELNQIIQERAKLVEAASEAEGRYKRKLNEQIVEQNNAVLALQIRKNELSSILNKVEELKTAEERRVRKAISDEKRIQNELRARFGQGEDLLMQQDVAIAKNLTAEEIERAKLAVMTEAEKAAHNLAKEIGQGAVEALKLADVNMENGVSAAAKSAAVLAANLQISLQAALQLQSMQGSKTYSGRGSGLEFTQPEGTGSTADAFSFSPSGGGGKSKSNQLKTELENLEQFLMTEEQLELESFQRRQEVLQEALAQRLITQQEHNELMQTLQQQHSTRMAELAVWQHGSTLQKTQQFLGDMASALAQGNDKMQKISAVFGAAEALVNAWRAYNQTLADPSLPWFAKVPAALSVLAAGMRAVSAIKGVSGGGGSAGGGGGVGAAGGRNIVAQSQTASFVNVSLIGEGSFSKESIRGLITRINEEVENGAVIKGITLA